jgi:hypothetical protein
MLSAAASAASGDVADAIERAIASGPVTPAAAPGLPATVTINNPQPVRFEPAQAPAGYLPTYYGGTIARADAAIVHITGGDEHSGTDIPVQLVTGTNIRVTVATPVPAGVTVNAGLKLENQRASGSILRAVPSREGVIVLRDVAPGRYLLLAQTTVRPETNIQVVNGVAVPSNVRRELGPSERLWARVPVVVSGEDQLQVSVTLQPGRSISGIVLFDFHRPTGIPAPARPVNYQVQLAAPNIEQPDFQTTSRASVDSDGRFTLEGVFPGTYMIRATGQLESSMVDGQDTLDFPLVFTGERDISGAVLTLSDRPTEISGTLSQPSGEPALDYTIVAAATDSRYWTPGTRRVIVTRPMPNGQYTVRGLPEGRYVIAAVTDLESGGQYDPEFLRAIQSAGIAVTLSAGGKAVQNIRVAR